MPKGVYPHKQSSEETKNKISNSLKGRKLTKETKRKIAEAQKYISNETRRKRRESQLGEKGSNWKGGISSINERIRKSSEYKIWRTAVFTKDNFTCIWCGRKDKTIQADHIKPFSLFPEFRFAIDNGRTLCHECHKTTNTYGVNKNN